MKRVFSLIVSALLVVSAFIGAHAQTIDGQNDLSVSYGFISGRQIDDHLRKRDKNTVNTNTGNFFVSCRHFFSNRCALGITAGTQTIWGNYYNNQVVEMGNYKLTNNTIALEFMGVYLDTRFFQLYSLIGIGETSNERTDYPLSGMPYPQNGSSFNFQLDPVCLRFGRRFSGFLEPGLGYKGLISGGLNYKLGKQPAKNKPAKNTDAG